jgi:hypothetical protein
LYGCVIGKGSWVSCHRIGLVLGGSKLFIYCHRYWSACGSWCASSITVTLFLGLRKPRLPTLMDPPDGIAPVEQDVDTDMDSGPGSPAPSLYSFHSSVDGRVMVTLLLSRLMLCLPSDSACSSCVICMGAS